MKVVLKLIMSVCHPFFDCYRMAEHRLNTIDANEKCELYLKEMKND